MNLRTILALQTAEIRHFEAKNQYLILEGLEVLHLGGHLVHPGNKNSAKCANDHQPWPSHQNQKQTQPLLKKIFKDVLFLK